MRSIAVRETPENKTQFARLVSGIAIDRDDPQLRRLLTRALTEGWGTTSEIAPACLAVVRHGPASALIARAVEAWPARLPAAELLGPAGIAALNDPLLRGPMDSAVLYDADIEKFLAACRAALLETAEATLPDDAGDELLGIASALARQCFINEYVYAMSDDEETRAQRLRERLDAALAANEPASPLWVAVVAAYFPLHELAGAQSLLARIVARTHRAPARATSPRAAGRGRAARHHPAAHADRRRRIASRAGAIRVEPLPALDQDAEAAALSSIDAYLRELLPAATFRPLGKTGSLDILIAGCGTGQHALVTGQQYEGGRTLAIDLSRASLAYAAAKTRELKNRGIEYAHADIMRLGELKQRFDLIESVGVLHHMADPWAGWRVLLSLLRPGGFMRIALYSEAARWGVVAARAEIAQAGYGSTPADIRRFRMALMQRDDETARNLRHFNDFYSMSECRDLLFHTQEHRMTLPQIKGFLAEQGLQLLGLEVDRNVARQYALRFPADTAMTDLDQWHAFEQDNTRTFE